MEKSELCTWQVGRENGTDTVEDNAAFSQMDKHTFHLAWKFHFCLYTQEK